MKENAISTNEQYNLEQNDFFIRKTSGRFLLSSILGMVSIYMASVIDTFLVGMYLGEDGLAAMSLIGPVYLVFYTVGATIGIGGSVTASRALGRDQLAEYHRIFTLSTVLLAIASLVMLVCGYAFVNPIMKVLSGSEDGICAEMARTYFLFYIPGGVMTLMSYIPLYFFRVEGKPKISSRLFTMSAVVNLVLSWIFISPVCSMGIAGVSLATSISMGCVTVTGFILILRGRSELRFAKGGFKKERCREMVIAGIPNGISNLLESARILLVNRLLIFSGAAVMLTCFTVIRNVSEILSAVIIGISSAIMPLAGVFFGERDYIDVRLTLKRTMKFGIVLMAVLVALVCIFAEPVFRFFGVDDPTLIAEGKWAIPLACFGLVAAHANNLYASFYTSINREGLATVLISLRLFFLLAAFAIPLAFTVGSKGVWLSFSLAEFATLGVFYLIRNALIRKKPSLDRYLLDTDEEKNPNINFSVKNDVYEIVDASQKVSDFCEDNEVDASRQMKVSLAIEEILTFLLKYCLGEDRENYVAVRICLVGKEVTIRFRFVGNLFNPLDFYKENEENAELAEDLLGIKMMIRSAKSIDYRKTLGANNLTLVF